MLDGAMLGTETNDRVGKNNIIIISYKNRLSYGGNDGKIDYEKHESCSLHHHHHTRVRRTHIRHLPSSIVLVTREFDGLPSTLL